MSRAHTGMTRTPMGMPAGIGSRNPRGMPAGIGSRNPRGTPARLRAAALRAAALGVAVLLLSAWQWPVPEVLIEVSFGEQVAGGVSPGFALVSGSQRVRPAEEGELVFSMQPEAGDRAIPHGLGNFVVLEHGGGFRSVYAHLDGTGSFAAEVGPNSRLGGVGQTGFSPGNTLGFRIIDTERSAYVNPFLLLPELTDGTAPRIEEVVLRRSEQVVWSAAAPEVGEAVVPGPAELEALVFDPATDGPYRSSAAVYAVTVFVNGQQSFDVTLETLSREGGRPVFSSRTPSDTLYAVDGKLRLGNVELAPGANLIEIVARDYAGNERVATLEIRAESAQ